MWCTTVVVWVWVVSVCSVGGKHRNEGRFVQCTMCNREGEGPRARREKSGRDTRLSGGYVVRVWARDKIIHIVLRTCFQAVFPR